MTAIVLATVGHGSTALWYLTRATGLVSLVLLSATVVLGTVASVGWTSDRWPRFLSQSLHRNLSLFCVALIGVHVVTTVGDGYVPIGLADAVHPVPLALSPDLGGTRGGGVRHALGRRDHQRAAPPHRRGCLAGSPLAGLRVLAHCRAPRPGLGLGPPASRGDDRVRPLHCRGRRRGGLAPGGGEGALGDLAARRRRRRARPVLVVIMSFAAVGPLRPGWSHRAGTSSALLAQLSGSASSASYSRSAHPRPRRPPPHRPPRASRAAPFETTVSGTVATSAPDNDGDAEVTLDMRPADTTVPLVVRIIGPAVNGGVALHRSAGDLRPVERAGDGPRRVHHRCARHRPDRLAQPDHDPVAESRRRHAHRPALGEPGAMSLTLGQGAAAAPRSRPPASCTGSWA